MYGIQHLDTKEKINNLNTLVDVIHNCCLEIDNICNNIADILIFKQVCKHKNEILLIFENGYIKKIYHRYN